MEAAGVLAIFVLVFAGLMYLQIRRVWLRYRVIATMVPSGSDTQAFNFKLTELIRSRGFREAPQAASGRVFRAPGWQRWAVGLQDISVEPAGSGAVLVTGPAFWVSSIGRTFGGATVRPYDGPQPVWPLFKGFMRLMGSGLALFAASILTAYLFGAR